MTRTATVVIPAHGGAEALIRLLAQLDEQARRGERLTVIVSDDGSPRRLADALDGRRFPSLELDVVRSEINRGPGGARNLALCRVTTPWVAFLDADMLPAKGWLERLEGWTTRREGPDGVEGSVQGQPGAQPTPFTHVTEPEGFGTHHGAGNVAFRAEVLKDAGGFDERFYDRSRRIHFREDTELHFRLDALGHRIEQDDQWIAFHPPLKASFWSPVRLARRYTFDPLLSREHPERFVAFLRTRTIAGFSLRWARHQAAVLHGLAAVLVLGALVARKPRWGLAAATLFVLSWVANAAALSRNRTVDARVLPPLLVVSALVPWVYLWSYYRGVIRFRHKPRLH